MVFVSASWPQISPGCAILVVLFFFLQRDDIGARLFSVFCATADDWLANSQNTKNRASLSSAGIFLKATAAAYRHTISLQIRQQP